MLRPQTFHKARLLLILLLPATVLAQLDVLTVTAGEERAAGGLVNMGSAWTGEPLDVLFRVRNRGVSLATLSTLTIQGAGFWLHQEPGTPFFLAPGFTLDFYVRYLSEQPAGDARGALRVNTATITLVAAARAAPILYAVEEDGVRLRRAVGQSTVFPPVERGSRSVRRFLLENPHPSPVSVVVISVSGDSFQMPAPPAAPLRLASSETRSLEIFFQPATSGLKTGALILDDRRYPLEGVGREPPFPRPLLSLPPTLPSATQARIGVRFDSTSRAEGSGTLRFEFQPAMTGPDDPAIVFPATNRRSVSFQVRSGETQALFGSQTEAIFQTGTTAGRLRFIAEAGGFTAEASVTIAPSTAAIDTITALRGLDILDLTVKGYDNTRSASEVAFTFYDRDGQPIEPGDLRSDVAEKFRRYFETAPAGGLFALRAVFPATGSTVSIAAVEIEFRNQAGSRRSERIQF
ncbi:MAG: hypothetical protein HY235_09375 [Acidobacteria bacterium]|nr:hypothetical protein [Acidobacteriota bacterium]